MMRRFLLAFVVLAILSGCGSSVTETTSRGDTSLSDIVIKDAVNERDAIGRDTSDEDGIIRDSEVSADGEKDVFEQDSGIDDSGSVEDVVEDIGDVIEEDISTSDVLSDTGTDVGDDAGADYCKVGEVKLYTCPDGSAVPECICEYKGCMPKCEYIGTRSEGWYDCDGRLIRYAQCKDCTVRCDAFGSKSEGWYSDCDGLIQWDQCAPEWKCVDDPLSLCVTKCQTPCDCPQDKPLCVKGICDAPILIGCNNDHNLCICGRYCSGNICSEGSKGCMRSCDCLSGEICVNETCKSKIGTDCKIEPCPCNQHCVEDQFGRALCQKGCENNCDCPSDNPICINGLCGTLQAPNCGNDDRNCPCMEVCINGACQKATDICDSPCDCKDPAKPSCLNMICDKTPDTCIDNLECPCGQFCIEGICKEVTRCLSACDCKEDEICQNNVCTKKPDNRCFNNNDCPCNYLCQNFQCVKAQRCKYSCDCPISQPPLVCRNGLCQQQGNNRCTIDNDCICGNYCNSRGFCVQGCNDGCDCPKESPYCLFNRCSPGLGGGCRQNSECPCEEVCKNEMCIAP